MDAETLLDMARHQAWADAAHWKILRENTELLEDAEIRTRLNHMMGALKMLTTLARGEMPDANVMKAIDSVGRTGSSDGEDSRGLGGSWRTPISTSRSPCRGGLRARLKLRQASSCCRRSRTASIIGGRTHRECVNWGQRRP